MIESSGEAASALPGDFSSAAPDSPSSRELQPLSVSSATVTLWGLACWVVALAATVTIPSLHAGDRHWWPWTCVAAIVIGSLGYTYVRRGRGNAASAT